MKIKAFQTIALAAWCALSAAAVTASFGDWIFGAAVGLFFVGIGLDAIFLKD